MTAERKKRLNNLPELPENRPALLMSAIYSGNDKKVYFWRDRTNHKPYCYTKMQYAGKLKKIVDADTKYTLETTKKRDLISDQEIDVIKIVAPDPLSIGGTDHSIREKITS